MTDLNGFEEIKSKVRQRLPVIQCNCKTVLGSILITLLLLWFHKPSQIRLLTFQTDFNEYGQFEPDIIADFDTEEPKIPKIQRIIHQTWKDEVIPPQFVDKVRTFVAHNPDWDYYLWTDASARILIKDHYPRLLPLWDGLIYSKDKIRRADALRYVVLYHYGGVYADMDVVDYRPLDVAITKHPCVFIPEPFEQAVFRANVPFLINNAIMMCAAGHPFLKQLVENLYVLEHMQSAADSTGPGYVTIQYKLYNNLPKEKEHFVLYNRTYKRYVEDTRPYFNQGNIPLHDNRSVYIANSQYFLATIDDKAFRPFFRRCLLFDFLTHLQKRACVNMMLKGMSRDPSIYAITDHKWLRTYGWWNVYNYWSVYNDLASTHIRDIVPHYKIYKGNSTSVTTTT